MKEATSPSTMAFDDFDLATTYKTHEGSDSPCGGAEAAGPAADPPIREGAMKAKSIRLGQIAFGLVVTILFLSPATANAVTCTSQATGTWATVANWNCGHVPIDGDDVVIAAANTITLAGNSNNVASVAVNGTLTIQANLTVDFSSTSSMTISGTVNTAGNNRDIIITGNLTINNGGSFAATAGTNGHHLFIGGNFTNNGTFNGASPNTIETDFNGSANQTVSGTGATNAFDQILVNNSGAANNNIVEISSTNFSAGAGFLTLTSGILKMSGSFTFADSFFSANNYVIAVGAGLWINNPNITVTALHGDPTLSGLLRVSAGNYNIGNATDDSVKYKTGCSFMMDGGTVTIAGRFDGKAGGDGVNFNMSGGTLVVTNVGSGGATGSLDLQATSSFTMSGGTIVIQNENLAGTPVDYRNISGTVNVTGGTVQFGTSTTPGNPTFVVGIANNGLNVFPSISIVKPVGVSSVILNTGTPINVFGNVTIASGTTLQANNQAINVSGNSVTNPGNWTNNGTFTPNTQTTTFNGTAAAQTIGGSAATAFSSLTIANSAGVTLDTSTNVGGSVSTALTLTNDLTVTYPDFLNETGVTVANSTGAGDVVGDVRRTDVGATPRSFGNVNVQITNAGTATTVDALLVKGTAPTGFSGAVQRIYTLTAASGTVNATVRLRYLTSELNGNTEGSLTLWRNSPDLWVNQGVTTLDTTNDWGQLTGITGFSSWALADGTAPNAPTLVRMSDFTAMVQEDGVKLAWHSGYEINNLGYQLYRIQNGQRSCVTPSIIAGSALITKGGRELPSGFSYGWFDSQGDVGTQYELQAIDLNGSVQTFAPRYALGSGPQIDKIRSRTLTEVSDNGGRKPWQRGWATTADSNFVNQGVVTSNLSPAKMSAAVMTQTAKLPSLVNQQRLASQPSLKIEVNQTGWYRVTQQQLVAAGFDTSGDAHKLQLYVEGNEVPIYLSSDKSKLNPDDRLEFYGVGLDELTTDTHVYYLVNGTTAGQRIPLEPDKGTGSKTQAFAAGFGYTTESKERLIYLPGILNGDDNNIFGQLVLTDRPAIQTVTLHNIDTANQIAQLEVVLQGITRVNHQVQVQLNGSYLTTINLNGAAHTSTKLPVSTALLREGDNTVTLTAAGGGVDLSAVDVLRMSYPHKFRADSDALSFSVGTKAALVSGFSSSSVRVIDITDPTAVRDVTPKLRLGSDNYEFTIQGGASARNLIAFANSQAQQPLALVKNQPSTWNANTNAADLLIVTHSDLRASAETLAAARRSQGMKVAVVEIEDVYDEFSYGAHRPQGLKDFVAWSSNQWATKPKYVLLFGDASWDPRDFMERGFADFVPSKMIDTLQVETASDAWLADFNGEGIEDLGLGRLPARNATDAATMVQKILNYDAERATGTNLRGALLVSDSGFESQSAQVQTFLSPLTAVLTLNRAAIGDDSAMRTQIVNAIDQGPAIVNYFGHGSVTVWTGAGLLNQNNAAALTNANGQSLFVLMTCYNGYFADAFIDSLGETVLKNPAGGAFAVWASSGQTEPDGQALINTQFYQLLLGSQPMSLGDAARASKQQTGDTDVRRTWVLLGDPSMRLK